MLTSIGLLVSLLLAGIDGAPDRGADEGEGPFERLELRGIILIDGTGGPPRGPLDILIEGDRIADIRRTPDEREEAEGEETDGVIALELDGMYVLPGFVDLHAHAGSEEKAKRTEYCYKLWLAHGVTTIRGVPLGPNDWTVNEKERSARQEIVAPYIVNYQRPPGDLRTPADAREWVRRAPGRGIDGLKLGSYRPEIMAALLDEARAHGLGSVAHLGQEGVAQMNAIDATRLGLGTVTHYYGHFEALLRDFVVQPWPVDHNHNDEYHRFGQVARLWDQIHPPGSDAWNAYLDEQAALGTTFDPTLNIYAAGRDLMRARNADWHDEYTLPTLFDFFEPSRDNHGSYFFRWSTADEIAWRNFYQVWFRLLNDYKRRGGRITTGSDSGFIYKVWGFGYIEELELLQEAGLHPLEVFQCATMNGALTLHEPRGEPIDFGVVREGLRADLVVLSQNPLADLKTLYATGAIRLDEETGDARRVRAIEYTIKGGVVYDVDELLADVREMVDEQKRARLQDGDG